MAKQINYDNLARFKANLDALFAAGGALPDWLDTDTLFSNIRIPYTNGSSVRYAKVGDFPALQDEGALGLGAAVIGQGKVLVVAPSESNGMQWSAKTGFTGGTATTDIDTALADMDGKGNTAANLLKDDDAGYANGYCDAYSLTDGSGNGFAAGQWWLPSLGELLMIFANIDRLNYALSLVEGAASILTNGEYWASTRQNTSGAWYLRMNDMVVTYGYMTNSKNVRPVTSKYL